MHYSVFGSGSPVVFLHGFLEDHSKWEDIAHELSALNLAVYLIDLPCHGKSRFKDEICSMQGVAELLSQFFNSMKIKNPFVFGHSMGGYIGLELIRITPIKLTLVHSNFWADSQSKKEDRNRVIEIVKKNKMRLIQEAIPNLFAIQNRIKNASTIEILLTKAALIPTKEIIACTKGMRDRSNLKSVINQHPIIIIHGDEDPIISTDMLLEELEGIQEVELYRIPQCGHMSIWENPAMLIKLIQNIVFR